MADLRALGSEKLQGQDKISRILEIANYGVTPKQINENNSSVTEYSIQLADGNYYGIVKEKLGYIVKKGINESEMDYIDPMKNRKYHKSYSQAMKKINLLAGELNRIYENVNGINLIGEQKKFVLKTPKPEPQEAPAPAPAPAPEEPAGEELDLDLGLDTETPTPEGEEEMDLDLGLDAETPAPEGEMGMEDQTEEESSFKTIQKLTGKLGQKLRTFNSVQGLSSEDIKYVLNSIISAVDLTKLSEEDKEDIMGKFEEDETEYDIESDVNIDVDAGEDDLDLDLDFEEEPTEEPAGEVAEYDSMKIMVDELFSESKVDKVLEKYFVISKEEKQINENKKVKKFLSEKVKNVSVRKEIKRLSETIEQELTSDFLIREHESIKFLGKTNKNNLVFEADGKQLKVSPKGELL
jgi:hypothetical protein